MARTRMANKLADEVSIRVERGEVQITATSPIPLWFCAGGDAPKLIPHTVSAGILGEASQLAKGTTEEDILEYYHVDFPEEKVYKTVKGGYAITATWNLGLGTVHFDVEPTENILSAPEVTNVTIHPTEMAKFTFTNIPNVPGLRIRCTDPIYNWWEGVGWAAICVAGIYFTDINKLNHTASLYCCSDESFEYDKTYSTEIAFEAPNYESSPRVPVTFSTSSTDPTKVIQITATSPIPLWFSAGGDAPKLIPHTVSAGIRGEGSELAKGTTEEDILAHYHVDFLEEYIDETVSAGYKITATWNLGLGTVHFNVEPTENILSAPEVTNVDITSSEEAKFTFTDIPNVPDLRIRCTDPIYQLRADGQWEAMCVAGIYFKDIDTLNNTAILPCCSSEAFASHGIYKTEIQLRAPNYESSPRVSVTFGGVPQVKIDIAGSIAAGGIPEAIRTGRDEEITLIVKNLGIGTVVADVFLTFENYDIPRIYPRDMTGLIASGGGHTLPGSDIMILDDAYVAKNPITIGAGASGSYMITVQLPHRAIPVGVESVAYTIKTKVGLYASP